MEYFKHGSLLTIMKSDKNKYTWNEKIEICRQISAGLLHIHRERIIHGDIALRCPPFSSNLINSIPSQIILKN